MQAMLPLFLSLVISGPSSQPDSSTIVVPDCQLVAIRDAHIPARQPGVLLEILSNEGEMVAPEQQMGQIDDRESKLRLMAAQREFEAAAAQAKEDIDVQAAVANRDVAVAELDDNRAINKRKPGTVSETEMRRSVLTAKRAALQIDVAKMEFNVAGLTAGAKQAMVDVGQYDIDSRRIIAPFAGLIVERLRQPGEWVQAGDPVIRLVQMDRLRVQGTVDALQYSPSEIEGRPVIITVQLPRGEQHQVESVVGYVSQVVEVAKEYRIWAEIENVIVEERQDRTFWKMRPGMSATMTINMSDNGGRR